MRPSCGLPLTIRVAALTILLGLFSTVAPTVSHAQVTSTLPKTWNDAVAKLGDKVAAAMSPTAVALSVENISSLDALKVAAIGAAAREQLQHHSFSLPTANSTAAQSAVPLQLTLSESAGGYLWVIQIPGDATDAKLSPTMIVSVSKSDSTEDEPEQQSLSLEKRFEWKQAERFLDFTLLKNPASSESTLLVLETKRVAVYKSSSRGWQFSRSTPIPEIVPPSRDSEGTISLKEGKISFKGFECVGDPDLTGVVQCKISPPTHTIVDSTRIPGLPNSLGTLLYGECRGETIAVYTGEGDWTQTDFLQGYLISLNPISAVPVGHAIQVRGPVISLQSEPDSSAVRAVVRNLRTGEYEGYIVTATCSH